MLCPLFVIYATDFYQPFKEDELEQSTEVQIIFPAEPKPVIMSEIISAKYVFIDMFT